jgi:uroporphyrin-III C-methyltransferase
MQDTQYPIPTPGASLVLAFRLQSRTTLIIGSGKLAASRAFSALEADSTVAVLASGEPCEELRWRAGQGQLTLLDCAAEFERDSDALSSFLNSYGDISFVCVTDTLIGSVNRRSKASASRIYQVCRARGIPVNTTDMPEFCDFSFTSTHRFEDHTSGERTCLQIGVTTNSKGCRLAGRVRRDIVARLPKEIAAAATNMGKLRALAKASSDAFSSGADAEEACEDSEEATPNKPVPLRSASETNLDISKRRIKWVAQVSEYWPIPKLAAMSEPEMHNLLSGKGMDEIDLAKNTAAGSAAVPSFPFVHPIELPLRPAKPGKIILIGSGPGHPSLLTTAAHNSLTNLANLVLSDKLVPQAVLALIPNSVKLTIARKFPGNADGAQKELMEMAVDAAKQGLTVVRVSCSFFHPHS